MLSFTMKITFEMDFMSCFNRQYFICNILYVRSLTYYIYLLVVYNYCIIYLVLYLP